MKNTLCSHKDSNRATIDMTKTQVVLRRSSDLNLSYRSEGNSLSAAWVWGIPLPLVWEASAGWGTRGANSPDAENSTVRFQTIFGGSDNWAQSLASTSKMVV